MDATHAAALVTRYYAAFNAGDDAGMLALLRDDVAHDLNQGPREIGRAAFSLFLQRMRRAYDEQLTDILVWASPDGSLVAAEYVVEGRYIADDAGLPPATGQRYRLPGGAFFSITDGRISRVTNYYNLQDWLQQVAPQHV